MDFRTKSLLLASVAIFGLSVPALAQDTNSATAETTEAEATTDETTAGAEDEQANLLTEEELDKLVGPIALYPDTLLIQILVGATYPIDIIKANRFVDANTDLEQEALNEAIDAEGWDASIAVLAQGFPTVLANMAEHIDWTELAGSAMLAQSDDVMDAVQRMREQADSFGNLETGEEQTVSKDETGAIVIAPTDPEIVYVPTYTPSTVYYESSNNDALIAFATVVTIGAIWSNNNPWYGYWGCRNCGGWGHRPINHRPNNWNGNNRNSNNRKNNINIDNSNNVNIGSNNRNKDGSWKANDRRQKEARSNIGDRKAEKRPGGKEHRSLGGENGGRGDDMRRDLSKKTGAKDISRQPAGKRDLSRPTAGNKASRPSTGNKATRPSTGNKANRQSPNKAPAKANRSGSTKKNASRPSTSRQPTKKATKSRSSSSFQTHGGGKSSRTSRSRGHSSRGGGGRSGGGRRR